MVAFLGKIPDNLSYTKTHEWVKVTGRTAMIGITDFAQEELHEIVFVELPDVGKSVQKGSEFSAVESVKARSEIFSPVSGKVTKVNGALVESSTPARPELLNDDPYGGGWMVEIELSDIEEIKGLLSPDEYRKLVENN